MTVRSKNGAGDEAEVGPLAGRKGAAPALNHPPAVTADVHMSGNAILQWGRDPQVTESFGPAISGWGLKSLQWGRGLARRRLLRGRHWLARDDLAEDRLRGDPRVRRLADQHLVEHRAECLDVGRWAYGLVSGR